MKIEVFTSDDRIERCLAESWARAFAYLKHDVSIAWYPTEARESIEFAWEIGTRTVGCNLGCPIAHYVYDPIETVDPKWLDSVTRGHLFFFGDHESYVRAHKQGIRTAEYVPCGWDSLAPAATERKIGENGRAPYDIGFFGTPSDEVLKTLSQVKAAFPNWRLAVWGIREQWKSKYNECEYQGMIPDTNGLGEAMSFCRYVMADPRYRRPDYFFMQACGSLSSVGISPISADLWEAFEQSRFLFGDGHIVPFLRSVDHPSSFHDLKSSQMSVLGKRDKPPPALDNDRIHCSPGFNRMIDRVDFVLMLLEVKNLYANAKGSCKEQTLIKMSMSDNLSWIHIGFPQMDDLSVIEVTHSGFKPTELPLMLRRAARRIEIAETEELFVPNTIRPVAPAPTP